MSNIFSVYNVVITNPNSGADLSAPSDGFVDFNTLQNYNVSLETTPAGLTYALAQAKRRANVRYNEIVLQMNLITNCYIVPNSLVATGATYKTPATSLSFQVVIEHGDATLYTADELNVGQFLTGTAALTRMIARGLMYVQTINNDYADPKINVFDPTSANTFGTPGSTTSVPRTGERVASFAVGALTNNLTSAGSAISITPVIQSNP
jgi:hypothetical protein